MTPSNRDVLPMAFAIVLLLVGGLVTASFRLGVRSTGIADMPAEFDVLADVYADVRAEALKLPDDAVLAEGAAEGLLAALGDPYAAYYAHDDFARLNEILEGSFSGVGLFLEEAAQGVLQVIRVIENGPAARAGVQVGERIVSVDGKPVAGLSPEEIIGQVRGPEGTAVRVGFDGGPGGAREVKLVRQKIDLPVIDARMLDAATGYVQLIEFPQDAGERVRKAVTDLIAQGARGIVFDLRGNPGGLLREAVTVASVFVNSGPIVSVKERSGPTETFPAIGDAFAEIPLVVLIDKGTASAAEIVAAAVKDTGRGRLVGTTTFGKGTVQVVRPLPNGGGLKFTTAEYLTASGASIEGKGVPADVVAEGDAGTQLAAARQELGRLLARGGR